MNSLIPVEAIINKVHFIRGHKVLLDRDLAELYEVETGQLKRAVRRNIDRFPSDFMFEMSKQELEDWRSQFGTSNAVKMGLRHLPMVFTEQGVAMLSSVINSKRAIQVNITIMRAFVQMRELLSSNKKLAEKLNALEKRLTDHDDNFRIVFEAIKQLLTTEERPKGKIGF
ncbi:MAG: ORF6N domain-containing protein [Proteobacteria bacterium]|nr:ORF6N domain-containing protein [Pseudomonadota bacterium]MBU1711091.1 ORF6N domain-containing protein [Pseudomonadota bacterium]